MNLFSTSRITNRFSQIDFGFIDIPFFDQYKNEELVSFEKSLENVSFSISSLDKYIQIAKSNCNKSGQYGLTIDESAAIYFYTIEWNEINCQSFYFILNSHLRNGNYFRIKSYFPYLKLLFTALNKLPSIRTCLWRNIQGNLIENYSILKQFRWTNIISCSTNLNQIFKSFWNLNGNNHLFQIYSLNGKNISNFSQFPNENEILLLPNTTFSVIGNFYYKNIFVTQINEI